MKTFIFILFVISILILLWVYFNYFCNKKSEDFDMNILHPTHYTHPRPGQQLRDPGHLAPEVFRVTNTILSAGSNFTGTILDGLVLPDKVKDEFTEWIDKGLLAPVKDQMLCGGCWAFATCGSLASRLIIATAGKWYPPFGLSEQVLISCADRFGMQFYNGCEGGIPHFAIDALSKEGVPMDSKYITNSGSSGNDKHDPDGGGVVNPNQSQTCVQGGNVYAASRNTYFQTGCNPNTSCGLVPAATCPCDQVEQTMESASKPETPFNVKYKTIGESQTYTSHGANNEIHTVDLWPNIPPDVMAKNVERMKKALYYSGPFTVGMRVTADFYKFTPTRDNYYEYCKNTTDCGMRGGHAVTIVGWKKINGVPVWIVKNSWGSNWGYGFPNGAQWKDPITGKEVLKYPGGFWNHIMGKNDSFIESNAEGANPDLSIPALEKFVPKVGKDWYQTMTLRDVYEKNKDEPKPEPTPKPEPKPEPDVPIISSNRFTIDNMTPPDVSPDSITKFMEQEKSLYILASNKANDLKKILGMLPDEPLSKNDIDTLVKKLETANLNDNLVISSKGTMNKFWHIFGIPNSWKQNGTKLVIPIETVNQLAYSTFGRLSSLDNNAPVLLVSKHS